MKVGDLVKQTQPRGTVPVDALGLVVEEDNRQRSPRWTIRWLTGNVSPSGHVVNETVGYGYGYEVISESR